MANGEKVPENVRAVVKKPFGSLYTQKGLLAMLKRNKISPIRIAVVGDVTGAFLIENNIKPAIWIYDGISRRKPIQYMLPIPTHVVRNPPGHITRSLRAAIDDVLELRKGRVYVQGQEDLAALYVMAKARGWLLLYGQPLKGIVAVKVGAKEQNRAEYLLSQLE